MRGASITSGKNGTYLNTGIPGTGLYNRRKISGGGSNSNDSQQKKSNYNGCGITTLIFLAVGLILIFTQKFENPTLIFAGCAIVGIIIDIIINLIVGKNKKVETTNEYNSEQTDEKGQMEEDEKQNIIENGQIDIDSDLTTIEKERFADLCQKFSELLIDSKIWFIKSLGTDARKTETIDRKELPT